MVAGARRPSQSLRAASARARSEGNGFAYAQVARIQRARILAAMFDVASELGAANVSVAHVVERSGVSRRTFYETFSDREDCFLAAFEDALAFASQRVLFAYEAQREWRDQIRAGLVALLCFLDEEPAIGRLLIVESLSGGSRTLERRDLVLARVAAAVDEGRAESASAKGLPALTAEGVVGGVLSIIHARIAHPGLARPPIRDTPKDIPKGHIPREHAVAGGLMGLANALVSMIVLPYLGQLAARRELECTVEPRVSSAEGTPEGTPLGARAGEDRDASILMDPFKGVDMRLTYRTVRVLLAVSEHAGASNRLIGETAGIADQGQISKLLGRLGRLGLIENSGLGPGQGAPNAWSLTPAGDRIVHTINAHTEDTSTPTQGKSKPTPAQGNGKHTERTE
jgi:AcrR family transcriptional regulator